MQEASASCDVGGDRENSSSYSLPPSLSRRPSFSLELYNRFSQSAMNSILPEDETDNHTTDMDIDLDTNADVGAGVLTGIPPVRDGDISPGETIPSMLHEKEKDNKERKRGGGDDISPGGNAAKRVSAGKRSDGHASVNDAKSKNPLPSGSSSTYSPNIVFKYTNKDRPPYIVQVQSIEDADSPVLHPLHISRLLSQISPRDIVEIRKSGRSRVIAEMRTVDAANRLISSEQLSLHKLKAFIPLHKVLRTGIIRDVPQDFSLEMLRESTSSAVKILEIHRLNRRVKVEGELRYLPSRTVCIKFAGQFLPPHVFVYGYKYDVSPFIPKTRICFSCFRVGHMSKSCKSQPRCIYCGGNKHNENEDCTLKNSPPECINCKGAHLPTSHECILVVKHKMVLSLASMENLSIADARKRINDSSSNSLPSFSDPRFDFSGFPSLPQRRQSSPFTRSSNRSFIDPNPYSPLENLSSDFRIAGPSQGTFSSAAALPPRASSHRIKRPFNSNTPLRQIPRPEDPRTGILVSPNGRSTENMANGLALRSPNNSSFISAAQTQQNHSSLIAEDFLATVKRCFDDLIQPFYHALVERLSHHRIDYDVPSNPYGRSFQPSSALSNAFTETSRYLSEPSQS